MYFHVCSVPARSAAAGMVAKWPQDRITYFEAIEVPGLTRDQVAAAYDAAALQWSAVAGLEFVRVASPDGANIVATSGPVDGPYGVLAYSELPYGATSSTVMHQTYDNAEPWNAEGVDMLVACMTHEIGHALGLEHIPNANALMDPYIVAGRVAPQPPDVAAMVALYGPPLIPAPDPTPAPRPVPTDPLEALGHRFAPYVVGPYCDALVQEARGIEAGDGRYIARRSAQLKAGDLVASCWEAIVAGPLDQLAPLDRPAALRKIAKGLAGALAP